jgi:hypothetical protein
MQQEPSKGSLQAPMDHQQPTISLNVEPAVDETHAPASNSKHNSPHAVRGAMHKAQKRFTSIISKTPRLLLLPLGALAALVPLLAIILPVVFKVKELDDNRFTPSYCAGPGINGIISSNGLEVDGTGTDAVGRCANENLPGIIVATKVATLDVATGSMTVTVNIFPSGTLETDSSSSVHFSQYDAFQMSVVELGPGRQLEVTISTSKYTFQAGDIVKRMAVEVSFSLGAVVAVLQA